MSQKTTRTGPAMAHACRVLRDQDGVMPSKMTLAAEIGPHGSLKYGYATIERCLKAGLVRVEPNHPQRGTHSGGAVVLTEKGARVAQETSVF